MLPSVPFLIGWLPCTGTGIASTRPRAHSSEVAGFGSSTHWRTSREVEPETIPSKPSVGPLTELAR